MFDSTRNASSSQRSRFGVGTVVSVAVHGGLIALVVVLTTRPVEPKVEEPKLTFIRPTPLKRQSSPRAAVAASTPQQRPAVRRDRIIPPKVIPQLQEQQVPPVEDPPSAVDPTGATIGTPIGNGGPGDGTGDDRGDSDVGTPEGSPGVHQTDVAVFGPGMTRPVIDREELTRNIYTREAREANVQGAMIISCQVLSDGTVRGCHPLKSLPLLTDVVISRLEHMHVTPVTFQGVPVSVNYIFNFQFLLPR
jgi:protein TonB